MDIVSYLEQYKNMKLNTEQHAAVTHRGGALLLAVPGAGKTTVVVSRIAHLLADRAVHPSQIYALTFSREAARDMAARFNTLFGEFPVQPPVFSTIHAFCYRLLRSHVWRGSTPEIITQGRQMAIFSEICCEVAGKVINEELVERVVLGNALINNLPTRLSSDTINGISTDNIRKIGGLYSDYKTRNRLIDFDDMLVDSLSLLKNNANLKSELRSSAPYLLLDEAQDTTELQQAIIEQIATPENLFIVGDEDQSIYEFRGADSCLMLDLPKQYPGIEIIKTQETFRLTPQICKGADLLISICGNRFDKHMYTTRPKGDDISFNCVAPPLTQGEYIARELTSINPNETVVVLYRSGHSALGIAHALDKAGIDFHVREQRMRMTSNSIVGDIRAFVNLSKNNRDVDAFKHICFKVGIYIPKPMINWALENPLPGVGIFERICDCPTDNRPTGRLLYVGKQIDKLCKMPPAKALDAILSKIDYLSYLTDEGTKTYRMTHHIQYYSTLRSIAASYSNFSDFFSRIDQLDDILAEHSNSGHNTNVTLSTIHSAKGMEFDHVYLVDLIDGVLPASLSIVEAEGTRPYALEEDVRLCYVAITRAAKKLTLLCPASVGGYKFTPSRFMPVIFGEDAAGPLGRPVVGEKIKHKFLGTGRILSVDYKSNSVTIDFGRRGIRVLHIAVLGYGSVVMRV